MTAIPVVTPSINGAVHAPTTASAGPDTIAPVAGRPTLLYVSNANAGATVPTIVIPGNTKYGPANPDITGTSIAAGAHGTILLPADIADPTTGLISVTFVPNTSVSLFAVSI